MGAVAIVKQQHRGFDGLRLRTIWDDLGVTLGRTNLVRPKRELGREVGIAR